MCRRVCLAHSLRTLCVYVPQTTTDTEGAEIETETNSRTITHSPAYVSICLSLSYLLSLCLCLQLTLSFSFSFSLPCLSCHVRLLYLTLVRVRARHLFFSPSCVNCEFELPMPFSNTPSRSLTLSLACSLIALCFYSPPPRNPRACHFSLTRKLSRPPSICQYTSKYDNGMWSHSAAQKKRRWKWSVPKHALFLSLILSFSYSCYESRFCTCTCSFSCCWYWPCSLIHTL